MPVAQLTDSFGRDITYLRLSVTDRCDLRCTYCMAENMTFLPRKEVLTLEELAELSEAFIARGVRKIRLTGGEPLVRRNIMSLIRSLSTHLDAGRLDEITLTTNATQLSRYADELKACGVERINVSLDSRDPATFHRLTRRAVLPQVMAGIDAGLKAGLKIKINTVALKDTNIDEISDLMTWAHGLGMDMTLIEVMPLGEIDEDRVDQYWPLSAVRDDLDAQFTLTDIDYRTPGVTGYGSPARGRFICVWDMQTALICVQPCAAKPRMQTSGVCWIRRCTPSRSGMNLRSPDAGQSPAWPGICP